MTVHKFVLPMFVLSLMTVACEEKKAADAEAATIAPGAAEAAKSVAPSEVAAANAAPAAAAAVAESAAVAKEAALPGPQDVCKALTEAAKAKDDSKILAASTPATATAFGSEGAKEQIITILAGATCGAPTIDSDTSASVALGTAEPIKSATFTKAADGWKFDGAAFLAKYPVAVAKEKAKKAAGKLQHKAGAHSKKHH